MKLLTQEIIAALPPLYATENIPLENKIVICQFFIPGTYWKWFIFEGQAEDNDFCFFGMVHAYANEMGYFYLSEFNSIYDKLGISVEREPLIFKVPYRQFMSEG